MKTVTAIKFTKFNLFYGDVPALRDITISIPRNKVTAVIGPAACGKSSFLRAINRLNDFICHSRSTGKICIGSECITAENYNRMYLNWKTAMLTSSNTLLPGTVLDSLLHLLKINRKHVVKSDIIEFIEKRLEPLGLWRDFKDSLQKDAFSLSYGPRRILGLAQLLLAEPKILLLDEPTINLDRGYTLRFEEIIPLLKKNMTVIFATRNNRQATIISDYTAFLYQGELIESGETMKFFTRPSHRRTENYLSGHRSPQGDKF